MLRPLAQKSFEIPIYRDDAAELRWPRPPCGQNLAWYSVTPGLQMSLEPVRMQMVSKPNNPCMRWEKSINMTAGDSSVMEVLKALTRWRPRPSAVRRDVLLGQFCLRLAVELEGVLRAAETADNSQAAPDLVVKPTEDKEPTPTSMKYMLARHWQSLTRQVRRAGQWLSAGSDGSRVLTKTLVVLSLVWPNNVAGWAFPAVTGLHQHNFEKRCKYVLANTVPYFFLFFCIFSTP